MSFYFWRDIGKQHSYPEFSYDNKVVFKYLVIYEPFVNTLLHSFMFYCSLSLQ